MFTIDIAKLSQVALSAFGAALLTIGTLVAAAGPAEVGTAPAYAEAQATIDAHA